MWLDLLNGRVTKINAWSTYFWEICIAFHNWMSLLQMKNCSKLGATSETHNISWSITTFDIILNLANQTHSKSNVWILEGFQMIQRIYLGEECSRNSKQQFVGWPELCTHCAELSFELERTKTLTY